MFKLTVTNPDGSPAQVVAGNTISHHFASYLELRRALIIIYQIEPSQAQHAIDILQNHGGIYDLSIVHETDNNQFVTWTARLEKVEGSKA